MVFHPPMLYLGYVGFSVPFAFAMAALVTRWKSEYWMPHIRRWTLIAWAFLTTGIMLGGWWAYYELGWGGYWAWDPVENASFMPGVEGVHPVHDTQPKRLRHLNFFQHECYLYVHHHAQQPSQIDRASDRQSEQALTHLLAIPSSRCY